MILHKTPPAHKKMYRPLGYGRWISLDLRYEIRDQQAHGVYVPLSHPDSYRGSYLTSHIY